MKKRFNIFGVDSYFIVGIVVAVVLVIGLRIRVFRPTLELPAEMISQLKQLEVAHQIGNETNAVQIVELSDYQCPACASVHEWTWPIIETYVRAGMATYTAFDVPLPRHQQAIPAATYAHCIFQQDPALYWTYRTRLYQTQAQWSTRVTSPEFFGKLAANTSINAAMLAECFAESQILQQRLRNSFQLAASGGVDFVPVLAVNGSIVQGRDKASFRTALEQALEAVSAK